MSFSSISPHAHLQGKQYKSSQWRNRLLKKKKKKRNKQDRAGTRRNTMFVLASSGVGKENLSAESGRKESKP